MGEGIMPENQTKIIRIAEQDEAVIKVQHLLSTYQSPEVIVLMLIITFRDGLETAEINDAIDRIRASIKQVFPLVRFVIIQPESIKEHSGEYDNLS
jgi:divalent metal cation (Fe/Co/Zn/Cd) transporter